MGVESSPDDYCRLDQVAAGHLKLIVRVDVPRVRVVGAVVLRDVLPWGQHGITMLTFSQQNQEGAPYSASSGYFSVPRNSMCSKK